MNKGPAVIGLNHYDKFKTAEELRESSERIKLFFSRAGRKKAKRTVFIECWPSRLDSWIDNIKRGMFPYEEPFQTAIAKALELGWKVRALDRKLFMSKIVHVEEKQGYYDELVGIKKRKLGKNEIPVPLGYLNENIRERQWAHLVFFAKPKPFDFILVHPGHVNGFVKQCRRIGLNLGPVEMLDRESSPPRRLLEKQIRVLQRKRNFARRKKIRLIRGKLK